MINIRMKSLLNQIRPILLKKLIYVNTKNKHKLADLSIMGTLKMERARCCWQGVMSSLEDVI